MVKKSRRSLTLLEIMVVLFIIGGVISVLTYSMKGSMDEGKCFKARHRALQMEQLLMMAAAQTGDSLDQIVSSPVQYLETTGLVSKGEEFIRDPWGKEMRLAVEEDRIIVWSDQYERLMRKKNGENWKEKRD